MLTSALQKHSLAKDEGGAVMIMGLAMILSLIAFMWFCLGIGETIVFRDHMQDAADSAAFSQTAVEAAAMNLLVLINMLIMLLVIVYLIASIFVTLDWAGLVGCIASVICLPLAPEWAAEYYEGWKSRNSVAEGLSMADQVLSRLQSGVALLAPWAGTAAGIDASHSFQLKSMDSAPFGLAVSPTNFPSLDAISSAGASTTAEYGLPVTHEHLGNDCAHLIDMIGGLANGMLPSKAMSMLNKATGAIGGILQWYYCDSTAIPPLPISMPSAAKKLAKWIPGDIVRLVIGGGDGAPYWTDDGYGPMENYNHKNVDPSDLKDLMKGTSARHDKEQKNGADHQQSYAFVITPGNLADNHATHNMGFMQLQHLQGFNKAEVKPTTTFYFAEAELYFDCMKGWRSPDCDDAANNLDRVDMTMYRFEWRARLVKFHAPAGAASTVFSYVNKVLGMVTSVKGWINGGDNNPFIKALHIFDSMFNTNAGDKLISAIGKIADIPPDQVFH